MKTVQVLELRQKRCSNRFGVAPCTATGSPKCFQTFHTCEDRANFNLDGELRWYFTRPGDPAPRTEALPTANDWYSPPIPILRTVRANPTRVNIGAVRENESPFGLRGEIAVTLDDIEFRNQFGDFYASERTVRGSLGRLLLAWLGEAVPQLEMRLYTGYAGQTLAEMTVRLFDVTNINPPSGGAWTVSGLDPLGRANRKKAKFPRATEIRLSEDISATTTAIAVTGSTADITDQFGNTSERYIRFNSEIVSYTGQTGTAPNFTLTGVTRGALGTNAATHDAEDVGQRCGHFRKARYYDAAYHILSAHTTIGTALIDYNGTWQTEGNRYLPSLLGTGTYTSPEDADKVVAELMRDGLFSVWWDERSQLVKMMAMRQPVETPVEFTERGQIAAAKVIREPGQRMTRVTIYYNRRDPTEQLDKATNYATMRQRIDGDAELPEYADGTVRDNIHYSRLVRADFNSVLVGATLLQRYRETPQYLDLEIAEKDASIGIGDVIAVTSNEVIDTLGQPLRQFWQIIEWEELEPGFRYRVLGQSFILFPRPSFIMANDAPDFATATDAEKVNACFITENDGTMPDGSVGYVIQ